MTAINNPSNDTITRFYFDDCDLRGEITNLQQSITDATAHQELPPAAQSLLAEFLSAACLLAGILKFEGLLTLQIRGDGQVPLIMAESTHDRSIRGIVKVIEGANIEGKDLRELVGNAILTLTIDPTQGKRYQGVVPLEGQNIADCLSHYFTQSEQLPTQMWLFNTEQGAGGLFLQGLPAHHTAAEDTAETWKTLKLLASTLTANENSSLEHQVQLTRLFHEYALCIAGYEPVKFACSCSAERSENALAAIGKQDAYALLKEQSQITIDCQFCGQQYCLNGSDLDRIFAAPNTQH